MITHSTVGNTCSKRDFLSYTSHSGNISSYTKIVAASDSLDTSKADYICDGVRDEDQLNSAIDAVSTNGGGRVFLQEGTYYIEDGPTIHDNVTLAGTGYGTCLLKGTYTLGGILLRAYGQNIVLRDLRLDGNLKFSEFLAGMTAYSGEDHVHVASPSNFSAGMSVTVAVRYSGTGATYGYHRITSLVGTTVYLTPNLEREYGYNYGEEPAYIYNSTSAALGVLGSEAATNLTIDTVWAKNCYDAAVRFGGSSRAMVKNCFLSNTFGDNLVVKNVIAETTSAVMIIDNHFRDSYQYDGLGVNQAYEGYLGGMEQILIKGNHFQRNAHHCIDFKGSPGTTGATIQYCTVSGNVADNCGDFCSVFGDWIYFTNPGGAQFISLRGNVGSSFCGYGIDFETARYCSATGNVLTRLGLDSSYNTFEVRKYSVGCIISGNIGASNYRGAGTGVADSDHNVISSNVFVDNNTSGVSLDDGSYNAIVGNICVNSGTGTTQDYGVYLTSASSDYNMISENITVNNSVAGVYETSTAGEYNAYDHAILSPQLALATTTTAYPIFIAPCPCRLMGYSVIHDAAATSGSGSPKVQIGKLAAATSNNTYFDDYTDSGLPCNKGEIHYNDYAACSQNAIARDDIITVSIAPSSYAVAGATIRVCLKIAAMAS